MSTAWPAARGPPSAGTSTRQLQPTREASCPEECPSGRVNPAVLITAPGQSGGGGRPWGRECPARPAGGEGAGCSRSPDRAASNGRAQQLEGGRCGKGVARQGEDRLAIHTGRTAAGVPGLSVTRQNSRSAPSRGRAWWKISLSPTDTPPVVITQSKYSARRLS